MAKLNDPHPLEGYAEPQAPASASAVLQANFTQATAFCRHGNFADAERICGEILHQQPNHFAAVHLLGEIALRTQRMERAVELFEKAIALKPDFAEAHSDLGMALRKLKRFADAVASYDKAIALKPDFAMAFNNRANTLLDMDRPPEALASCDKAIALNPGLVIAHYNRGNALEALKRPEEALASFERAIELRPNFAEANWNKALCLLLLGRFEQGLPLYEWRKWRAEPAATSHFPGADLARERRYSGQDPVPLVGAGTWRHHAILPLRHAGASTGREGHHVGAESAAQVGRTEQPDGSGHRSRRCTERV